MQSLGFWIKWCICTALLCLLSPAHALLVSVVCSEKTPAFQEAADSLVQELVRGGVMRQDILLATTAEFMESGHASHDARLVVTLGTDAFRQIAARNARTVVLAGLIPRIAFERVLQETNRKNAPNVAALYLDQPFGRQLDLLRLAMPAGRRIGVIWGPESIVQQPLLNAALSTRGLELSEGLVSESTPLISALRSALNDADVLLAMADSSVFNPSTVSNILLTSYRAKTAVMAFSPAYVKAGALLSVHSTAAQAGAQLATLAAHFLQSNVLSPSQYPTDFTISGNEYVAHSLGISLDVKTLTERLRKLEKRP